MKNLKKLFLVPVLALGTMTSCYGGSKDDTKCPEVKECDVCPSQEDSNVNLGLKVTYENGDEVSSELNLLFDDSNDAYLNYRKKKLKAVSSVKNAKVSFKSSDERIASVTNDGLITALKANACCQVVVSDGTNSRTFDVYTRNLTDFFGIDSNGKVWKVLDKELEELTLPEGYSDVDMRTFDYFTRLKKLTIPEGYTKISNGDAYFAPSINLFALEEMNLPSTLTSLQVFKHAMPNLKKVTVGEGNPYYFVAKDQFLMARFNPGQQNETVHAYKVFNGFDGNFTDELIDEILGEDSMANEITIRENCALGVQSIKNLRLPERILMYDNYGTFVGSSVETLSISRYSPAKPRSFIKSFLNCKNLREISFLDDEDETRTPTYSISDGCLLNSNNSTLYLGTSQGVIPESVTTIETFAFYGREFVNQKLKIPSTITTIKQEAFGNTNLQKVWFPSTVSFTSNTKVLKNLDDYDATYSSATYFNRGKNCTELVLDSEASTYTGNKLGTFALSNPSLTLYDGNSTDRGASIPQWRIQARRNFLFDYVYDVSEEEFDSL